MNIAALSSQLQRIPDQALAQEMRYPSGAVPQFLILTELQRRQKMRASSSDGDIPASTVAQDVMGSGQQRTPPAGLPAIGAMRAPPTLPTMPVTGMYRGGQVRRFSQGTPDGLEIDPYTSTEMDIPEGGPPRVTPSVLSGLRESFVRPSWKGAGTRALNSLADADLRALRGLNTLDPEGHRSPLAGAAVTGVVGAADLARDAGILGARAVRGGGGLVGDALGGAYDFVFTSRGRPKPQSSATGSMMSRTAAPAPRAETTGIAGAAKDAGITKPGAKSGGGRDAGLRLSSSVGGGGSASARSGSSDDEGGLMSIYKKMRESGEFDAPKADRSKLEQLMALQQQQGPGLALAKAGFKMAAGTSPFFATNAGEGLAGLSDDLRQQNIDSLKGQLELEGLSAKEAEAEATRRYNMLRLSGDVLSHRDAVDQRREAALGRLQEAHYARLDRLDRVGEAARARGDARLMSLYGVLDRGYNTAYATAQRALEKERAAWQGDMANMGKPFTKTIEEMDSWTAVERAGQQVDAMQPMVLEQFGATLPAPAAADPRGKPGNKTTRPPLSSFGG